MNAEQITILCMTSIALSSIWHMPPESAEKIAIGIGAALGGYLSKTMVDMVKNAVSKPPEKATVSREEGK